MFSKKSIFSISSILIVIASVYYSFYSLVPHDISDDSTPLSEFSTSRAMVHVKNMTEDYHFVGTPYHQTVKKYVIAEFEKLGFSPEIQKKFSLNQKWRGATMNENILVRIKGQKRGKALLLLSHYDSAPFASKGASDDAVGVAVILEGIRLFLKNEIKPINDIIILITDGEEIGLVGAKAFVEHHNWAKEVGLVINFEARGSGGPSYTLLETNGGNAKMVKEFVKANPKYPIANSFLYSVYKMLPNDTDLTMFREIRDIEGYNFAFIDDFFDYHSSTDNFENVNLNTVEHQGDYLMSLLNYFSKIDFKSLKSEEDLVFFNFPGFKIIYYPFSFALPIFIFLLIIFIALLIIGIYRRIMSVRGILIGLLYFIASLGFGVFITYFGWELVNVFHPSYIDILHGFPYNGHLYIAGFMFIILTFLLWFYNTKKIEKVNISELLVAPILFWFIVNGVFVTMLIGASFMIIPVIFILVIFSIELFYKKEFNFKILLFTILSIPALIIISPFIDMFPVGLKLVSLPISALFFVLLFGLLIPVFQAIKFKKELVNVSFIVSFVIILIAELNSGFNVNQPKPNSINYYNYIDEKKAFWETYNHDVDYWLEDIMGVKLHKGSYKKSEIESKYNTTATYYSEAKLIDIAEPLVTITQDLVINGSRTMEITILPQRKVHRIDLVVTRDVEFESFAINGVNFNKKHLLYTELSGKIISYYFTQPEEEMKVNFSFDPEFVPEILIYEISYNLLTNDLLNIPKRPEEFVPMPFIINDAIVNVKKLNL